MESLVTKIEETIGYSFKNKQLLLQAITHKSYTNEQLDYVGHNERLEFLGDAVLELAISDLVYHRFSDIPEGGLTRIRAEVVSEKGLSAIALQLHMGTELRLGKGEQKSGGSKKPSLLADALEALLGAIYCDGGFVVVCKVIEKVFSEIIEKSAKIRYGSDYKTCLQERVQALYGGLPEYILAQVSGPDHERIFSMEVCLAGKLIGKGSGSSKKNAEQKAAAVALDHPLLKEK